MSEKVTVSLSISGHFPSASFPAWIAHRATLLSLCGWVKKHDKNNIAVQISGDQILVDAFEAACSLGPMDVVVDAIDVQTQVADSNCRSFRLL